MFNIHPGEILKEYLDEMEITAYRLSRATGISESNLSELINGKKILLQGYRFYKDKFEKVGTLKIIDELKDGVICL